MQYGELEVFDDNYFSPCINDILDNALEHRGLAQAVLETDLNEVEEEIPFGEMK